MWRGAVFDLVIVFQWGLLVDGRWDGISQGMQWLVAAAGLCQTCKMTFLAVVFVVFFCRREWSAVYGAQGGTD